MFTYRIQRKTCSESSVQTIRWVHVIRNASYAPYFPIAKGEKRMAKKYCENVCQKQQLAKGKY